MTERSMTEPGCIACGTASPTVSAFRSGPFEVATCQSCGLRWVTDPPQGDEMAALYSSGFYEPGPAEASRIIEAGHAFNNRFRLRELRGLARGRLLDVGCGRGRFLAAARDAGWEVLGIEFEPGLAQLARQRYGVEVIVGDALDAPVSGPYDAVTMWHVLEHLPDPLAALERARDLLQPGGRLVVSVPNNASWQARLGGDDWLHLDIPRHIYHFTPRSLSRLVEQAGFRVERIGFLYPEMEALGVLQTSLNRFGLDPDLLYRFAKRDRTATISAGLVVSLALGALLLPVALAAVVVAPLLGQGASMQLVATRAV